MNINSTGAYTIVVTWHAAHKKRLHIWARGPQRDKFTTKRTRRAWKYAAQMLCFKAATGKAFTIFRAGFAFTTTTFPKTSLLPALVAGFMRVLILQSPGRVNTPLLFTSLVPTS